MMAANEVAAILGVTYQTVQRWARAGKLVSVELPGGSRRFHRSYIDLVLIHGVHRANDLWRSELREQSVHAAGSAGFTRE